MDLSKLEKSGLKVGGKSPGGGMRFNRREVIQFKVVLDVESNWGKKEGQRIGLKISGSYTTLTLEGGSRNGAVSPK